MSIKTDATLFSVVREEHLFHNDFFLRFLDFPEGFVPTRIMFTCFSGQKPCYQRRYEKEEIATRLAYSCEELGRYRESSLERILGISHRPQNAFLHEYFAVYTSQVIDTLRVSAQCGDTLLEKEIPVVPYESRNRYHFPMKGTFLVTDTYPSINSHRWCRNSEFAFDVGKFADTLESSLLEGEPVYAACDGVVEEAFDGLENTTEKTDFDLVEKQYGEHVRIDGNHVLLRHKDNEFSLYAHLLQGSVTVQAGETVSAGQLLGKVGSSGSSVLPHLHFHVMKGGIEGAGVPVCFENLFTVLGEPCALEDTVNLIYAK